MLNVFRTYTLLWWQISLLKASMLALGLAIGTTWPRIFADWTTVLWGVFVVPAVYLLVVTLKED